MVAKLEGKHRPVPTLLYEHAVHEDTELRGERARNVVSFGRVCRILFVDRCENITNLVFAVVNGLSKYRRYFCIGVYQFDYLKKLLLLYHHYSYIFHGNNLQVNGKVVNNCYVLRGLS